MPLNSTSALPPHVSARFHAPQELLERDDITLPQLYEWNAHENQNYPLFVFHDGTKLVYIDYAAAHRAINRAARFILTGPSPPRSRGAGSPPVIAMLANADTITYICTALGVVRAGCAVFVISTRNGAAAVTDMLRRTRATELLFSSDPTISATVRDAIAGLESGQVFLREIPTFEDLFVDTQALNALTDLEELSLPETYDMRASALILHSSGSTGHPKPVYWNHKRLFNRGKAFLRHDVDISQSVMGCHGTPMFHGAGWDILGAAPLCGFVIATFAPDSPPRVPAPDAVWTGMVATRADFSWAAPSFIEQWSRDPEKIPIMRSMRGFMSGGAPLKKEVGDALASQGVAIFNFYGCSEVGMMSAIAREHPGADWEYFKLSPMHRCIFVPQEDGRREVVVLSDPESPLSVVNANVNGQDAYATNDIVEPHPTEPGLWRLYGRIDEQVILSNGEKTNPIPLEAIINEDVHVKTSVIFGKGRFQNGILVQPTETHAIDPSDLQQLEKYRNLVWPTIERANDYAPQHSRIFKEMILVASPSKPLQMNAKGLPRRKFIFADYSSEIDKLYEDVESSTHSELDPPAQWDDRSTLLFVRDVVINTLGSTISDNADIFRSGGDSLQATRIRNVISRAIRKTNQDAARRVPSSVVFDAPTIISLAATVSTLVHRVSNAGPALSTRDSQDLWHFVGTYSAAFPARPAFLSQRPAGSLDVVLITGTTGGFGCDALEHLLRDASVARVYAFNRRGTDALARQHAQFRARGLDETLLDTPKFKMVEAVLHEPGFGLAPEFLEEIQGSVTHIMHNAWKVDFNLSLSSFGVDLQGARNLVDLAISSPFTQAPTILFVSSVSVFTNYGGLTPAPEAALDDPASAFGAGYSESKWVTERVLQNAAEERGIHCIVMRLGQVAGDKTGHWNEKEWFPALVKSAQFQRCLPDLEGNVTWVPGYEGAKAFTELRHSPEPFVHLVHPRPVSWRAVIAPVAAELGVPLVSHSEWLSALQKSVDAAGADEVELMKANPALRLLQFYRGCRASPEREPFGMVYLSTTTSGAVSHALANLPVLDAGRVKQWLEGWQRTGHLQCLTIGQ
ncbi:acetyl-CoA synthetase-like protein [Trametes elegans]|nr:acetyl-CoA synthetase-like protein [Trametes elegans]